MICFIRISRIFINIITGVLKFGSLFAICASICSYPSPRVIFFLRVISIAIIIIVIIFVIINVVDVVVAVDIIVVVDVVPDDVAVVVS